MQGGKEMKLCSVCDKKINGSWCKNCHRFVKTYNLADGIYLNESHNPANDRNCTYHTHTAQNTQPAVRNTQSTMRNTQSAARNTQTARNTQSAARNTQQAARNTQQTARNTQTYDGSSGNGHTAGSAGTKSGGQAKQKHTGLIVAVIIILYVVVVAASTVIPLIADVGHFFTDNRFEEETPDDFTNQDEPDNRDENDPLAEAKRQLEEIKQLQMIKKLEPVETEEDDDYIWFYYNPEEIQKLEFVCNMQDHFDWTLAEFDAWLKQNMDEEFKTDDILNQYYNYYYESGEYWGTLFSSYRDYIVPDYFGVRVDYDTAMEKLHGVAFISLVEKNYTALYFAALKKLDPGTDWTLKKLSEELAEAELFEEETTVYSSDVLTIYSEVQDGVLSIVFCPAYE